MSSSSCAEAVLACGAEEQRQTILREGRPSIELRGVDERAGIDGQVVTQSAAQPRRRAPDSVPNRSAADKRVPSPAVIVSSRSCFVRRLVVMSWLPPKSAIRMRKTTEPFGGRSLVFAIIWNGERPAS